MWAMRFLPLPYFLSTETIIIYLLRQFSAAVGPMIAAVACQEITSILSSIFSTVTCNPYLVLKLLPEVCPY